MCVSDVQRLETACDYGKLEYWFSRDISLVACGKEYGKPGIAGRGDLIFKSDRQTDSLHSVQWRNACLACNQALDSDLGTPPSPPVVTTLVNYTNDISKH